MKTVKTNFANLRNALGVLALGLLPLSPAFAGAQKVAEKPAATGAASAEDPLLTAMRAELDRSKASLKMGDVPAPLLHRHRVADISEYDAEAAFGALREDQRLHARSLRVVVRVGDYKQDMAITAPAPAQPRSLRIDADPVALLPPALGGHRSGLQGAAAQALSVKKSGAQPVHGRPAVRGFRARALRAIHRAPG